MRRTPMKRGTGFKKNTGKSVAGNMKKARRAPNPLKVGQLGERVTEKLAHWRSKEHMALVAAQPCIVTRSYGVVVHHPQECFPLLTAQARKIPDWLCVPLVHNLHDPATPGSLHHMNSYRWWIERDVNVYAWLRGFLRLHYPVPSEGVQFALEVIAQAEANRRAL